MDLTVGLAGDGSREGFGDAVFDEGCELTNFFVRGAGESEGLRLWVGDVLVDGLADLAARLDGVASVISGTRAGSRIGLSSMVSPLGSTVQRVRPAVFRCQPGDGDNSSPTVSYV